MPFRSLHRLTLLGLVFFVLGLAGVAFALIKIYGSDGATDPALMRSLLVAAGMQLTGYVLLNRNRYRLMFGKSKK
jgi:hypothetical protein